MSDQLAAMTAAAAAAGAGLPVMVELRDTGGNHYQATRLDLPPVTQIHLVCAMAGCGQSVACLSYDTAGGAYVWTLQTLGATAAAHAMQCHAGQVASHPPLI